MHARRIGSQKNSHALSPDDLSRTALPPGRTREIDLGLARVRAARMSYVGGPGYELYVPVEMSRHVDIALHEVRPDLADAGYYALDALRIEAGRRAYGAELGADETPFEAGLLQHVALDRDDDYIGKAALLRRRGEPPAKKLAVFVFDDEAPYAWGGETILVDGTPAGELSSAGWSLKAGRCIGLGYLRGPLAAQAHAGTAVEIDVWGERWPARAYDRLA